MPAYIPQAKAWGLGGKSDKKKAVGGIKPALTANIADQTDRRA